MQVKTKIKTKEKILLLKINL